MRDKPFIQAAENNKKPILACLRNWLDGCKTVLEIGSGTGQHAVFFAGELSHLQWQPSELHDALEGLGMWVSEARLANLKPAIELDVTQASWPSGEFDAIYTANTFHFMTIKDLGALLCGANNMLAAGGQLIAYGPFNYDHKFISPGNERLDAWLKGLNPEFGIRDISEVSDLAEFHGLKLESDTSMPANNRLIQFRRVIT